MDTDELRDALGVIACTFWVVCVTLVLAFGYVAFSVALELHSQTETAGPTTAISRPVASKAAARHSQAQRDHAPHHVAHAERASASTRHDANKSFREPDRRAWAKW